MLLSIITINYNDADALRQTMDSVLNQTWKDFEYIIIDGGSKDESVNIIKANEKHLSYWVSEKDNGVFNAMNKGIPHAKGEYLLMLNAGDYLAENTVFEKVFGTNPTEDIIACDVYRSDGKKIFDTSVFPDQATFGFMRHGALSHQATFIRRSLHETVGLYDEKLRYAADWKFLLLALCKYSASYKHISLLMTVCDTTGLTCRPENFDAMQAEMNNVLKMYFPAFLYDYEQIDRHHSRSLLNRYKMVKNKIRSIAKKSIGK